MEAGIVGLARTGKTTLFDALTATGADSRSRGFTAAKPNVRVVAVPDPQLALIAKYIPTQKLVPAPLKIVDIAGVARSGGGQGEGLGNKLLSHLREVDAILHVVRCFEDPNVPHEDGSIDPMRDIGTVDTELLLADLQAVEAHLDRLRKLTRGGDKDAIFRVELLEKCQAALGGGKPVRSLALHEPAQVKAIREIGLLTAKKVLFVANINESDLGAEPEPVRAIQAYAAEHGGLAVAVCAKIEAELIELPEAERAEMLGALGMKEPALAVVARAAYELLGLQSFYTAGEKEVRAWPIPRGATAPQAAGVIHSDFERGFIRVEVYQISDLVEHGTEAAIKHHGKMRLEGKSYVMQNHDVCHFLFNV
jgi:ribosome-binding ATPase